MVSYSIDKLVIFMVRIGHTWLSNWGAIILSTALIGIVGIFVWSHHLYTSGL